jgi:hypothetical protein
VLTAKLRTPVVPQSIEMTIAELDAELDGELDELGDVLTRANVVAHLLVCWLGGTTSRRWRHRSTDG